MRTVLLERGPTGFGFNLKGTIQFGGPMQAVNGKLYPPLQYVSAVDPGAALFLSLSFSFFPFFFFFHPFLELLLISFLLHLSLLLCFILHPFFPTQLSLDFISSFDTLSSFLHVLLQCSLFSLFSLFLLSLTFAFLLHLPHPLHTEGPAAKAGLRDNDRIFEVNGRNAQGAAHSVVVGWVCACPKKLTLRVMGVSDAEAARLRRIEESAIDVAESKKSKVLLHTSNRRTCPYL